MNINNSYIKRTSSTLVKEAGLTADNLIVAGQSLTDQITGILGEITSDNLLQADTPSLSGNNTFSGSNSMPSISIPSSFSANATSISLAKLPRLTTSITPSDNNDLVTKSFVDGSILDLRPLNNTFSGNNTFSNVITCATIPSANSHLSNKQYVDLAVSTNLTALKSGANAWTGSSNTFNTSLPTSTQTPTTNFQLTNKLFVDNSITNLKSSANTWSAKQTVNNAVAVSTSHASNYYDASGNSTTPLVITDFDTGNNTNANLSFIVNGTNGFSQLVAATQSVGGAFLRLNTWSNDTNGISIGSNYTRIEGGSNHLTVDKINGITIKSNPKIDSYILPSNDLELVPKKFVDDSIANKKTFITSFGKSPNEGLNVNDSVSSKGIIVVPNAGAGNYNPSITDSSTAIIARSSTIDTASLCIAPHSNTNTGIQMSMNNINIGCGGLTGTAETSITINSSSGIQFSKVPILSTDLTSSITDDKCLTNKKYVDNQIGILQNEIDSKSSISDDSGQYLTYGYYSRLETSNDPSMPYQLVYPYMGTYSITNTFGYAPKSIFIQTKKQPATLYALDYCDCELEITYWLNRNNSVSATYVEGNAVKKSTPFTPGDYAGSNTGFPLIHKMKIHLNNSISGIGVLPKAVEATLNGLVSNYAISSGQNINTQTTNATYTCRPLRFTAQTLLEGQTQRLMLTVAYPNWYNNPMAYLGGVNAYGFSVKIAKGFDPTGVNGWFLSET